MVPTHDLAVQIHTVVKAVTRGRAWRCLILTKATQKAVCESSRGSTGSEAEDDGEEENGGNGADGFLDEDDVLDENDVEVVDERDGDRKSQPEASSLDKPSLGIDILIATPERLHHLIKTERLSLARCAFTTSCVSSC